MLQQPAESGCRPHLCWSGTLTRSMTALWLCNWARTDRAAGPCCWQCHTAAALCWLGAAATGAPRAPASRGRAAAPGIELTVCGASCATGFRTGQCLCNQQLRCSCNRNAVVAMAVDSCRKGTCTAEAMTSPSRTASQVVKFTACSADLQVLHCTHHV